MEDKLKDERAEEAQVAAEQVAVEQTMGAEEAAGENVADEQVAVEQAADDKKAQKKAGVKQKLKSYFTATRIAYMALFTALSYALRFLEFSLLPAVPFLKLDFSNIFPLIGGYALGPVAGMTIGALKEILWMSFTSTAGVGEIANIIIMLPFVLVPTIAYKYKKGLKSVYIFLAIGCVLQVVWSFPANLFLNFPVFAGFDWPAGMALFMKLWYWVILFNLIKAVLIGAITLTVYKPISNLIKLTGEKFEKRRAA